MVPILPAADTPTVEAATDNKSLWPSLSWVDREVEKQENAKKQEIK